jgi:DNA-binding transcriptional LysR family regulator
MNGAHDLRPARDFFGPRPGGWLHARGGPLGITQSAVSHAIKQLETELGVGLFERAGAALALTAVGRQLLVRANDILQQKEALQQEAGLQRGIAGGTLRLASFGVSTSLGLLPGLIARYQQAHPQVEVQIEEASTRWWCSGCCSAASSWALWCCPTSASTPWCWRATSWWRCCRRAALAAQASVSARDFHGQPFIRTSAGSGPHIDRFLAAEAAEPRTLFRFEQLGSIMGFVAQGRALTIAARLALPEPPPGVVYRPLRPARPREIALAALKFERLSPAARAFVDLAARQPCRAEAWLSGRAQAGRAAPACRRWSARGAASSASLNGHGRHQLPGLVFQALRGGRAFLHQGRVLLRGLVQLGDGQADLVHPSSARSWPG